MQHQLTLAGAGQSIRYSVNKAGQNKDWNKADLTAKFEEHVGTLSDVIAHIEQGFAVCAGVLKDGYRDSENFVQSEWVIIDIDHGWTIAEALQHQTVAHATLLYTTCSHRPGEEERFRIVFRLPQAITDFELYESLIKVVLNEIPQHDPQCKDGVRIFYGNTGATFPLINDGVTLPGTYIERAKFRLEEKEQQLLNPPEPLWETGDELDFHLAKEALTFIPQRKKGSGNYGDCIRVVMALNSRFKPEVAQQLIDGWSPKTKDWNPEYKQRTLKKGGVSLGSLFHLASSHGFDLKEATKRLGKEIGHAAKVKATMEDLQGLDIEPAEVHDGYFPHGQLPSPGTLLLIDGPMGSGKTSNQLKGVVTEYWQKHPNGKILTPGLRNLLLRQNAIELGLEHVEELKDKSGGVDKAPSVAYCWDSSWRILPGRLPQGTLLMLDEVELGFLHLLDSETIAPSQRAFILNRTKELFETVINNGGYIVAAQFGITNITVDFIYALCGKPVPTKLIKSQKKGTGKRSYTLYSSPSGTWGRIERDLQKNPNINIIGCSDTQRWLRQTERWLIEQQDIPEKDIWILDRESSEEQWARDFAQNPDRWIQIHKPRVLLFSPSIQMGVSITEPHFEKLYFHLTHLEPRSGIQMPDRYRVDCPRYGYIRESANSSTEGICLPDEILGDYFKRAEGVERLTGIAEHLQQEGEGDLIPILSELHSGNRERYTFWLQHLAKFQARAAYEKAELRQFIMNRWKEGGHKVTLIEYQNSDLLQRREAISEKLQKEESEHFAAVITDDLCVSDAQDILNSLGSTKEERDQARKVLLLDRYPGIDFNNPETVLKLVIVNRGKFLRSTALLWAMQNPEQATTLDRKGLLSGLKNAHQKNAIMWLPSIRSEGLKADLLNRMPLIECIHGNEYTEKNRELKDLKKWAVFNASEIKRVLRLQVKKDHSSITIFNKLARKLGYHPAVIEKRGSRGNQIRVWKLIDFHDSDREQVLEAIEHRFQRTIGNDSSSVVTTGSSGGYVRVVPTEVEPVPLSTLVAPYVETIRYCLDVWEPAGALCAVEDMFGSLELEQGVSEALSELELEQLFMLAGEAA